MKILSVSASNFASYKQLNFQFDNQGLCLIQGSTGSGKSTLCDLVPYVLFGRTAKDGAADDVISWNADSTTFASVSIEMPNFFLEISRCRGKNANDLYYQIHNDYAHGEDVSRGKDLNDTQKRINQILGITYETYMAGSYFHEWSKTAAFFTTTAKNRRDICEQLVDLAMAKDLQNKASDLLKEEKAENSRTFNHIEQLKYKIKTLTNQTDSAVEAARSFDRVKSLRLEVVEHDEADFDHKRQTKLIDLNNSIADIETQLALLNSSLNTAYSNLKDPVCDKCGTHLDHDDRTEILKLSGNIKQLETEMKVQKRDFEKTINVFNPYTAQLASEQKRENTYIQMAAKLVKEQEAADRHLLVAEADSSRQLLNISDLELLQDTLQTFRATLITGTMGFIQDKTNSLLSDYFDGELKVIFDVKQADKLDVLIYKDGNECTFTQLSKGQRQLLKLTFGISVMQAVANHSGVKFNCLFLDEALSGLDDSIKLKAFRLFESMSIDYSSIFVIDHNNDFKSLFSKKYTVSLSDMGSIIEETN